MIRPGTLMVTEAKEAGRDGCLPLGVVGVRQSAHGACLVCIVSCKYKKKSLLASSSSMPADSVSIM